LLKPVAEDAANPRCGLIRGQFTASNAEDVMESSVQLWPIAIECDAPSYDIVKASGQVGMRTPEDVRWCRKPSPARNTAIGWQALAGRIWRLLFAFGLPDAEEVCLCGRPLPERRPVLFRSLSRGEARYALAQCGQCRTIFWDHLPAGRQDGAEVDNAGRGVA
jgi:hypothetical protein